MFGLKVPQKTIEDNGTPIRDNIGEPSACGYDPDQEVYVKDN